MAHRTVVLSFALAALVSFSACKPKPPTSPHCIDNTTLQFNRIDERVKKYQAGEQPSGAVYWARYYLETARFVLTGKGIDGSGAGCTSRDHDSRDYKRLMKSLAAREKDVKWMEEKRGVTFDGVANASLSWTWKQSSQPVGQNDANTL